MDIQYGHVRPVRNLQCLHLLHKAVRIFRAGQGLPKTGEAEAVMNALPQNTAQVMLAFQDQNVANAFVNLSTQSPRRDIGWSFYSERCSVLAVHYTPGFGIEDAL